MALNIDADALAPLAALLNGAAAAREQHQPPAQEAPRAAQQPPEQPPPPVQTRARPPAHVVAARRRAGGGGGGGAGGAGARKIYPSSTSARKVQLEQLEDEAQAIVRRLRGLQLDNQRLRMKHVLLQSIIGAMQQLLPVLMQHLAEQRLAQPHSPPPPQQQQQQQQQQAQQQQAPSASGLSASALLHLRHLEAQVLQLQQQQQELQLPARDTSSSNSDGSNTLLPLLPQQLSSHSDSLGSSRDSGGAASDPDGRPLAQLQQAPPPQQQAQRHPQPDPREQPLWLLLRCMQHLNLSAAVTPSPEERLTAYRQVQGQVSLLLHTLEAEGRARPELGMEQRSEHARARLQQLFDSWGGHVISAHIVSPYEHVLWSVTNMEDLSLRNAPLEFHQQLITTVQLTAQQRETIALGLMAFHELLAPLKAEQTRLQLQLQQMCAADALQPGVCGPAGLAQLGLLPGGGAADDADHEGLLLAVPKALQGVEPSQEQEQVLQRLHSNNWRLSWMIALLNFFVSGVMSMEQLCRVLVHSYPWPWWPGPFAEEVLRQWHASQAAAQQELDGGGSGGSGGGGSGSGGGKASQQRKAAHGGRARARG